MWSWREKEWKKYDSTITSWNIVQEVDDNLFVAHQVNKLSDSWLNPIWDRDLSILYARFEENGAYYFIIKSVEHPKIPDMEKERKYIRSFCNISAYVFAPDGSGKTQATRVVHVRRGVCRNKQRFSFFFLKNKKQKG